MTMFESADYIRLVFKTINSKMLTPNHKIVACMLQSKSPQRINLQFII